MNDPARPLPQPLYESLPFIYAVAGIAALAASWHIAAGWLAWLVFIAGIGGILGGLVVWLRRRDYRSMQERYGGGSLPD